MAAQIKKEMKMRLPEFEDNQANILDNPLFQPMLSPAHYMRNIDTSFESFFYQRDYTLYNFNFYLQVLAQ
jgi:hypothetical protein